MSNKYADRDGYKRVEAYVAIILDGDDRHTPGWAKKVLADEVKLAKVIDTTLGYIRDSRKNDPECKGLSARRRWVEAAVVDAFEQLATLEAQAG